MRYLGIDYGQKKVGLAFSEGLTASPLKTLEVSSLKDALEKVRHEIIQLKIDKVIVGLPESGLALKIAQSFIKALSQEVEVLTVEETLTTKSAFEMMKTQGLSRKKRQSDDAFAASLILQNYLDEA